ncbi:M24 family metallopeptidase [Geomonas subterranea]|uniref:M24 family metallopeptidase n=1 Tax=Geomonas subterranea TaxID=2847989 RepID=A0ABX8LDH6_9BACT|nr:M24 family metallopeptidase [Geomonas subterranea]QXE90093.1 M24 family metallopeptidase [Geomonas subterranea]QXM07783.1 M24 family metallopeptidase [Geomonas subterranea]
MNGTSRAAEAAGKVRLIRETLCPEMAVRLKGVDWFAWVTAGGSNEVLLAAETGVAEVVVTPEGAYVITNEIEAQRLADEQLPEGFELRVLPWAYPSQVEVVLRELAHGLPVCSDRPDNGEHELPLPFLNAKRVLTEGEVQRYRSVGLLAAQAMTEVLTQAQPEWTERQLAAAGGRALLSRGLAPALILASGERRGRLYRHPLPTGEPLGRCGMLVFCARGFGLYANLTRFVVFGPMGSEDKNRHQLVREIEARALSLSRPDEQLDEIYRELSYAYAGFGFGDAIREHHQGGITGYLSREVIAGPESREVLQAGMAVAWNPSLAGAKIEDTFLITETGLLNLTIDPVWPSAPVAGLERPLVWQG